MTHEQKPESAEFRTRAEQIVMIMCEADYADIIREKGLEELFDTILAEAEARGAAEQRRKDGEIDDPVGWCLVTSDGAIINGLHEEKRHAEGYPNRYSTDTIEPLYLRTANVAALEARVKELEGVNEAWIGMAANALTWLENGRQANARDELKAAQRRAAAIREGGE